MRSILAILCLTVCCSFPAPSGAQEIRDGKLLLTAMHDRYKDSWYSTVVFRENAITHNADGTNSTEVWDEALQMPGKLRINRGATSDGNGVIFNDGVVTSYKQGKVSGSRPFVHMLLVLGFDVYRQDAKTTIDQVATQGYDLSQIHQEKWEGEECYVVGAAQGDLKSKQFWIEKKRLLFVRVIAPDDKDAAKIHDTRFRGYQKLGRGWISARVEFYTDGKDTFDEDYFDIKADVKLDPALFDTAKFSETKIFSDSK